MQHRRIFVTAILVVKGVGGDGGAIGPGGAIEEAIGQRDGVGKAVVESVDRKKDVRARRHEITAADHVVLGVSSGQGPGYGTGLGRDSELDALEHAGVTRAQGQLTNKGSRTGGLPRDGDDSVVGLGRERIAGKKSEKRNEVESRLLHRDQGQKCGS